MKTGRLLKFQRPAGEVHVYLFREGPQFKAVVYHFASGEAPGDSPIRSFEGPSESTVEAAMRQWLDERFPRNS